MRIPWWAAFVFGCLVGSLITLWIVPMGGIEEKARPVDPQNQASGGEPSWLSREAQNKSTEKREDLTTDRRPWGTQGKPPLVSQPLVSNAQECEKLAQENKELHEKVAKMQEDLDFELGKPVDFPEKLDEKFLEKGLIKNLNQAFRETGVDAEVSFVDCDEYPCIACGQVGGQEGEQPKIDQHINDLKRVGSTKALSVYAEAEKSGSIFTQRSDSPPGEGTHRTHFCNAFFPKTDDIALQEAIKSRLAARLNKIQKAL